MHDSRIKTLLVEVLKGDEIRMTVPLFIRMLEFAKEDAKDDIALHLATENIVKLHKSGVILLGMENYDKIVK